MSSKELFTLHIPIDKGLYGASDAAATPSGHCIEAINADFSKEGVVRKRRGYRSIGGKFPVRCNYVKYIDTDEYMIRFDSQPSINITGTIYPFGTEAEPGLVNGFIEDYHLADSVLDQCSIMIIDEEFSDILLTDKPIRVKDKYFLTSYRLTDRVYVIPKWSAIDIQGTSTFSESGISFAEDVIVYRGPFLPYLTSEDIVDTELDLTENKVKLWTDVDYDKRMKVGGQVLFDVGIYDSSYNPVKGVVEEVNDLYTVVSLNAAPVQESIDLNYIRVFYCNSDHLIAKNPCTLKEIDSCNAVIVNGSGVYEDANELFFLYGVSTHLTYPCWGVGVLDDKLITVYQNTPYLLNDYKSYSSIKGATIPSSTIVGVRAGVALVNIDNSKGYYQKGDEVSWYSLNSSGEVIDKSRYEIVSATDTSISLSVPDKKRLFIPENAIIYLHRTTNEVIIAGDKTSDIYGGASFYYRDGNETIVEKVSINSHGDTVLYLSEPIELKTNETYSIMNPWSPVPVGGSLSYPNVVNREIYIDEYSQISFKQFGDMLYFSTEDGIWRFNGSTLISMNFGAPCTPNVRKVFGTYGSLPTKSDSSGSYAEEHRFSVTYYWEDSTGRGMESTYVSSEDLRIRPGINENGNSTWLEFQVPTFPNGFGVPAYEVKIRVYGVSLESDSNIMTLIKEVSNNPDVPFKTVIIGDRFNTFYGNYSKDQAFPDVARDSPRPAPRAKFLEVANGCLVAANCLSEPKIEVICDKLFRNESGTLQDNYRMKFIPTFGEEIEFVGVPARMIEGVPAKIEDTSLGFDDFYISEISSVPTRSMEISSIYYSEQSHYLLSYNHAFDDHFPTRYFSGLPGYNGTYQDSACYAILHPLEDIDYSIDVNEVLFKNWKGDFVADIKSTERQEVTFESYPFGEALKSGGDPYDSEPAIFILSGRIYLGTPTLYSSAMNSISGKLIKILFWNDVDDTLGNLSSSDGKVLSWRRDIVLQVESSVTETIELNGIDIELREILPVRLTKDEPTGIITESLMVNDYVDVTNQPGGNSHGSFSIFVESDLGRITVINGLNDWIEHGESRKLEIAISSDPLGLAEEGKTYKIKLLNNDGTKYENTDRFPDVYQSFKIEKLTFTPTLALVVGQSAPKKPPIGDTGFFNAATTSYITGSDYDTAIMVPEDEIETDIDGNFAIRFENPLPTGVNEPQPGDWCYLQLSGKSTDSIYLAYSGWFKIKEVVDTATIVFWGGRQDRPTIGENSLVDSYCIFGKSNKIPVPMPYKDIIEGDQVDFGWQLFSKTDDETTNVLNSMVSRFSLAINTILRDRVTARWGSSPTGDFASDYLPSNGFQITPRYLVDRYAHIQGGEEVSFSIDKRKYDNPSDIWWFGGDSSEDYNQNPFKVYGYITRKSGVANLGGFPVPLPWTDVKRTETFDLRQNSLVEATYTDYRESSSYWWTSPFYGANNEVRLPIFTFLATDSVDSSDGEGISGLVTWRDSLVITKRGSLWKAIVGDNAEKRRIESPVGAVSQPVATSQGVFFLSDHGVYATDGNSATPIRNTDRQFSEHVSGNPAITNGVSHNHQIDKTLFIGVPWKDSAIVDSRFRYCYETGAWSIDTGVPATGYASRDGFQIYSSYDGKVLVEKRKGEVYSDNGESIPFKIRTKYAATDSPDLKLWRQFILYLGSDNGYNLNVGYSKDFEIQDGGYEELPIKPASYGSNFGKSSFGGSSWVAPFRVSSIARCSHLSLSFENDEKDAPVEIFSIWLEGQKLNTRKKKEKKHYE